LGHVSKELLHIESANGENRDQNKASE